MTERESCQVLGIEERTWYRWKNFARNRERLSKFLDKVTGSKIKAHLANIEAGAIGAGPHKRADWRASQAILGIIDRNRFSPAAPPPPVQTAAPTPPATVNVWIDLAYAAGSAPAAQVVDTTAKQIEDKAMPAASPETQPASPMEVWMKPPPSDPAPSPGSAKGD
jgi:hypothetical protein